MKLATYLVAAAAIGAPASSQTYPNSAQSNPYPRQASPYANQPYSYQQQGYANQQQQGYGYSNQGYQQGDGYQQGYGNNLGAIIDQLLGNRYTVSDRTAIRQCASAAMSQAGAQYRNGYGANGYNQWHNRGSGYNNAALMRVTAITGVERRRSGLRVSGLMSSGGSSAGQYGYQNGGYAQQNASVSFRCNVDYRGQVSNVHVGGNTGYRRH